MIKLESISVAGLDLVSNTADVRRDLHAFIHYAQSYEIKRSHRGNEIPLAHRQRLAKLLSDPAAANKLTEDGDWSWINLLDNLSLALKFVSYDTKGEYQGYSSSEPSFPDNYLDVNDKVYEAFLTLSLRAQEEKILDAQVQQYSGSNNEFYEHGPLSRLDRFDTWGCATGVMTKLNFSIIRHHLLDLLAQCPSGVWFSTLSLIEHLRAHDPYFLIPQQLPSGLNEWERVRYYNFHENKSGGYRNDKPISDKDPRGFFKVEGRYIERFLECIPLHMGYVELAYGGQPADNMEPSFGRLSAFRLTDRFLRVMRHEVSAPKITVLPNFEVHIDSLLYPASALAKLLRFCELKTQDVATILKLTRPKVAAFLTKETGADVQAELKSSSGAPLPPNVAQELAAWAGHSDNFVLYEGFGLLEGDISLPEAAAYVVEKINPNLALVRSPDRLNARLEKEELAPVLVKHKPDALTAAPDNVKSLFTAERAAPSLQPQKLTIRRQIDITLKFPNAETHAAFSKALLEAKCVVDANFKALTVSYPKSLEAQIKKTSEDLCQRFPIHIQDA